MDQIYLDYAAATPVSASVIDAMKPFLSENFYNPSALYIKSSEVAQSIAKARSDVANVLGCKTSEIVFVSGGTESDNLAINGVMQKFSGKNIVVSAVEHSAVLEPAKQYDHRVSKVHKDGRVDINDLALNIDENTVLVSVMYANNEIGTVQPIREVAKLIKEIRLKREIEAEKKDEQPLPLYLHTDACQAANYLPLLVNSLGVDLMTLNGGKIYGPKQSGILFVRTGVDLKPQILGGGQERGIRSGTENVPSIIGFAEALKDVTSMYVDENDRLTGLRDSLVQKLEDKFSSVSINGSLKYRLPNNLHITISGIDNERLMMELDQAGILVATGSACSASSDAPSHVLKAVGLSDGEAQSSLRITFGRQTNEDQLSQFMNRLSSLIAPESV